MEAIQDFLKKYDQIPSEEKCIALLRAEEKFLKVNLEDDNDDDNYDKESIISMNTDTFKTPSSDAITTSSQIKEPEDSLIMEDEDINTIPEKESDEENESSVEPIPYPKRTTLRNFLDLPFEFDEESISSDENLIYDEVLEEINDTNYLIDSIIDSSKIDPLLEDFIGELALINPIPPRIDEINFDHEENIRVIEKLLYDNSSPRPPEELNSEISIKSFSPSPIPVEDSDSLIKEIDTFLALNDSIPPGIDSDGNDSEEVNFILEYEPNPGELTRVVVEDVFGEPRVRVPNVLPTHPTFSLDSDFTPFDNFSRSGLLVSFPSENRNKTFDPRISIDVQSKRFLSLNEFSISFISDPLSPVLESLLLFSSENKGKVFNPGILVSKEEKSLSHRGFTAFKIIYNFHNESTMMIYGGEIPILDVPYILRKDFKAYTGIEPQAFIERMLQDFNFIQTRIDSGKRMKVADLGTIRIAQETKRIAQGMKASTMGKKAAALGIDTSLMEKVDNNTIPNSSDMCNNEFKDDHNADDHEDERVVLANLIANLKLVTDENKKFQNKLRNSNAALTHELNECKYALEKSNDIRDRCRIALHQK
uniref:Uncharacterized protein n=1 Tax=Tanacetum cinerariifolium TaxID=118510 RepID=A0A6L2K026_TANCI|nr:hypothetical protein [Tanacetum cinerariifolium]